MVAQGPSKNVPANKMGAAATLDPASKNHTDSLHLLWVLSESLKSGQIQGEETQTSFLSGRILK